MKREVEDAFTSCRGFQPAAETFDARAQADDAGSRGRDRIKERRRGNVPETGKSLVGPHGRRRGTKQLVQNADYGAGHRRSELPGECGRAAAVTADPLRGQEFVERFLIPSKGEGVG